MQAVPNLPRFAPAGQPQANVLLVRTTKTLRTSLTRLVIPQGTFGKILSIDNQIMLVDFNLITVCRLPVTSALVEFVRS